MREPAANGSAMRPGGGFFFNVNLVFLTTILVYGLAFLYVIIVSRALGPDGRGVTALYQSAANLGFAFFGLGLNTALIYYAGRREISTRAGMEASLSISLLSLAITAGALLILLPLFGDELRAGDVPYWLMLFVVPAMVQARSLDALLRAQGRFSAMNLLDLVLPLTILSGVLVLDLADELTPARTVAVWSLALIVPVTIGYVFIRHDWPRSLMGPSRLSPLIRFGVQGQLSNLIQLLNYRLDSYLLLFLVNASGVGLYAVGVSLSEGLWFIANSVSIVLLTNLTAGDEESAARMTPLVCRNTILTTALAALAAGAVSPWLIPLLFGRAFEEAIVPFLWLLPGTVAIGGTKVLAAYVFSRGTPLTNAWIALASLVLTVSLDLALIPSLEVTGAAIGSSVGYCLSLMLTALAYRRLSGQPLSEALLPRPSDAAFYVNGIRSSLARLRSSQPGQG